MLPLIATGIKAISGMGLKKAVSKGAKNFVSGKGRNKKTNVNVGKKKGGRGGYSTPGQIVVAGSTDIVPTTSMVGGGLSTEVKGTGPSTKKVSIESMTLQLENIVAMTTSIEKITKKTYKSQKDASRKARVQREKDKKRKREEKQESLLGKAGKGALGVAKKVDDKFNILNFLTQILLGSLVLAIIKNFDAIAKTFKFIGENLSKIYYGFRLLLTTFKSIGKSLLNIFKKTGSKVFNSTTKGISNAFKSVGKLFSKVFKGIGGFALKTARAAINFAKTLGRGALSIGGKVLSKITPKAVQKGAQTLTRGAQNLGKGAQNLARGAASRIGNRLAKVSFDARLATRGIAKTGGQFLTKAGKLTKGAGAALKSVAKGFGRIPIVGPLIVALSSFLSGDPLNQTLFKTFGAAIGGLLGTFVPFPGIGTILGGLIGEYVGDLLYVLFDNGGEGGLDALGKRLSEDLKAALSVGKAALEWVGKGFARFYEVIPKFKLPDLGTRFGINLNDIAYGPLNLLLRADAGKGIQDVEIPNPLWMLSLNNIGEKAKLASRAFFSDDPMDGSETEEAGKETSDTPQMSGTMSSAKIQSGNQTESSSGPERSSEVGEVKEIPKPNRDDFGKGRSGAKKYQQAMKDYKAKKESQNEVKVQPQETKIPEANKSMKVADSIGATATATMSKPRDSNTMDTVDKPQPTTSAEITAPSKPSMSVGIESQASYEGGGGGNCGDCEEDTVSVLPPKPEPSVSGGSGGGSKGSFSGGDMLNSVMKQQVLGFLYKG